jgi:hypothetical protein
VGSGNPSLLRRVGWRRFFHRLVVACGLVGTLLIAPSAAGVPGDPTPPEITPLIFGTLGANGWYISNVTVQWLIHDPESPDWTSTPSCNSVTLRDDTPGQLLRCSATSDGGTHTAEKVFRIDKTAPVISTGPERQPDANGWYNRPLTVWSAGTDATSAIDSCGAVRYAGPDNPGASVTVACKDLAGNTANASVAFKYDATAPTLFGVTATVGNRSVELAWRKSSDTAVVEVVRAPGRSGQGETVVYRGSGTSFRDSGLVVARKYEYRVIGIDEASNRVENKVELTARGALLSPAPGTVTTTPPTLVWTSVARASYYNVQLVRGRKIFSAWPTRTTLRLPGTWIYKGRRYRLRPGVYRWYVWPGFGRISAVKYGRMLGGSTFVVPR